MDDYQAFVDKFKPKRTTDDCYTPEAIYDAVRDWACARYKIDPGTIVRPFYPGGDYQTADYPEGCTVLDNPPFSIFSKIVQWYEAHHIRFFLFAPGLTPFTALKLAPTITVLCVGVTVEYENGAKVNTSFVTNLEPPDIVARSAPELYAVLEQTVKREAKKKKKQVRKLAFPPEIITAAKLSWLSSNGMTLTIRREQSLYIKKLDLDDSEKSGIFGGGLLLSERAAAERAAAEQIPLSARERLIVRGLSAKSRGVEKGGAA